MSVCVCLGTWREKDTANIAKHEHLGYRGEGCYSCSFFASLKLHQNKMFKTLCA